jgi:hypothetical protein
MPTRHLTLAEQQVFRESLRDSVSIVAIGAPLEPIEMTQEDAQRCADLQGCPLDAYLDLVEHEFGVRPTITSATE